VSTNPLINEAFNAAANAAGGPSAGIGHSQTNINAPNPMTTSNVPHSNNNANANN